MLRRIIRGVEVAPAPRFCTVSLKADHPGLAGLSRGRDLDAYHGRTP